MPAFAWTASTLDGFVGTSTRGTDSNDLSASEGELPRRAAREWTEVAISNAISKIEAIRRIL